MTKHLHDLNQFVHERCLNTSGLDVLSLTSDQVQQWEIEDMFGLKQSKNGYKFDKKVGPNCQLVQRLGLGLGQVCLILQKICNRLGRNESN